MALARFSSCMRDVMPHTNNETVEDSVHAFNQYAVVT